MILRMGKARATISRAGDYIDERLGWLQTLPAVHAGDGFAVLHASPTDLWRAPMANATEEEIQNTYAQLGFPMVIYGHIHVSYVRAAFCLPENTAPK